MFYVLVMDFVYLILAVLCAVLGLAGAVLPVYAQQLAFLGIVPREAIWHLYFTVPDIFYVGNLKRAYTHHRLHSTDSLP